jgi:predicted amidohydrolase
LTNQVRVAAAQYPIDFLQSWQQFEDKLSAQVAAGAAEGAQLLVFPEYGSMELASLFGERVYSSLPEQLVAMQDCLEEYRALYRRLAEQHGVYILAGSYPVAADGGYRNRAYLFGPNGAEGYQDKLIMTRFESERWGISPAEQIKVFHTRIGRIGVSICYDSEFPLIARAQAEAGAEIILAPSCTESDSGYFRVRIGSQARALENQCHVVQAVTVGQAPWSEAVDVNIGAAGIYTPVDAGFPSDGILAKGERNAPGWVSAELDLHRARTVRKVGQVLNFHNWPRQGQVTARAAEVVEI